MFTQDQISKLLTNKNVIKCSPKSITYRKEFKIEAVKKYYNEGYSPGMIFEEAGFDSAVIHRDKASDCLRRWKIIFNRKGEKELMKEGRGRLGGRPKKGFKDRQTDIEYLKTKIAYLEAENDFLAKLRGLKRE